MPNREQSFIPSEFVDFRLEGDHVVLMREHPVPALSRLDRSFEENRLLQLEEPFSVRDLQERIVSRLAQFSHNGHPFDTEVERRALVALQRQA
jgi:hypothetical protein